MEYIFGNNEENLEDLRLELHSIKDYSAGFIFNYPPIPTWNRYGENKDQLSRQAIEIDPKSNLYIHIPFCSQKCSFCYYSVLVGSQSEFVWSYLHALEREAEQVSPLFEGRELDSVYIGGGTPTYLTEDQISFLFERVIAKFPTTNSTEITFESSPETVTIAKTKLLRQLGVNRMSMGVQSMDNEILAKARRNAHLGEVLAAYEAIRLAGIDLVNFDLIPGVEMESEQTALASVDKVLALPTPPDQVTLYTLSVRQGAISYKSMRSMDEKAIYSNTLRCYSAVADRLLDSGFNLYSKNIFIHPDADYRYQKNIWGDNQSVIGLGASAYSKADSLLSINYFSPKKYIELLSKNERPVEKLCQLSVEEAIRRHVVLSCKNRVIDMQRIRQKFSDHPLVSRLEGILQLFCEEGIMTSTADHRYTYTVLGMHESDKFIRAFYSEQIKSSISSKKEVVVRGSAFEHTI